MPTKEVLITIRLQIDTDADVRVEVNGNEEASQPARDTVGVEDFIRDNAPRAQVQHQLDYLRRCVEELQCSPALPDSTSGRTYVNVYPPKRYGAKRASAFETRSGRVHVTCSPSQAEGRRFAEAITHNGEPVAVKVYLSSAQAVDEAVELTRIGLEERR